MRFPVSFSRWKGGGTPILGSDAVPSGAPSGAADNRISVPHVSRAGMPARRVSLAMTHRTLGSGAGALAADLYLWEELSQQWYKLNASTLALNAGQVVFAPLFNTVAIPKNSNKLQGDSDIGDVCVVCVPTDPGTGSNGQYVFSLAIDLARYVGS